MIENDYFIEVSNLLSAVNQGAVYDWKYTWTIGNSCLSTIVDLPTLPDHRPPSEEDYHEYISLTEKRLINLIIFLKHVGTQYKVSSNVEINPEFTSSLVLLCALHSSNANLWTSHEIAKYVEEVLSAWMDWMGVYNLPELLSVKKTSVGLALRHLSDIDDWMTNPHPAVAFEWIVFNVDYQRLVSGEQSIMLAMSLRLLEDFQLESNLAGIRCLNHLLENVTRVEFQSRSLVYVETLMRLLNAPKCRLIGHLVPCLLATIKKTRWEEKTAAYDIHLPWSKYDDLLASILTRISLDEGSEASLQRIKVLTCVLQVDPIVTLRHTKQLLDAMERTLALGCAHPRHLQINQRSLEVLGTFVEMTEEYTATYTDQLGFILLKKKFDVSRGDPGCLLPIIGLLLDKLDVPC